MKRKTTKKKRSSVAIDTVPLPEKVLRTSVKKGKISRVRGKYFLTVGRRKVEVPAEPIISRKQVVKMVGKEVYVAFSKRKHSEIVAIGTWPTPERPLIAKGWILCYLPAPDLMARVNSKIREKLVHSMVSEKIITSELARELRIGLKKGM